MLRAIRIRKATKKHTAATNNGKLCPTDSKKDPPTAGTSATPLSQMPLRFDSTFLRNVNNMGALNVMELSMRLLRLLHALVNRAPASCRPHLFDKPYRKRITVRFSVTDFHRCDNHQYDIGDDQRD